ncbi:hypothetical protein Hanom_Chr05g00402261 [Helianthus anomalus]
MYISIYRSTPKELTSVNLLHAGNLCYTSPNKNRGGLKFKVYLGPLDSLLPTTTTSPSAGKRTYTTGTSWNTYLRDVTNHPPQLYSISPPPSDHRS